MQVAVPISGAALREMVTRESEGHCFQVCGLLVHKEGALAEPKARGFATPAARTHKWLMAAGLG
jgi:hypothetical protein